MSTSEASEEMGTETTGTTTQFTLFSGGSPSPYATPRVAFDVFAIDGLSLGGFLGLGTLSTESEISTDMMSSTQEGPSAFAAVVGVRLGYAFMFNDLIGLWPHAGVSYFNLSLEQDDGDGVDTDGTALSLDAMLLLTPVEHFGFALGPVVDIGLSGGTEVTNTIGNVTLTTDSDNTITNLGVQANLVGWF